MTATKHFAMKIAEVMKMKNLKRESRAVQKVEKSEVEASRARARIHYAQPAHTALCDHAMPAADTGRGRAAVEAAYISSTSRPGRGRARVCDQQRAFYNVLVHAASSYR